MGVPATTRLSPYVYNDAHDIDECIEALGRVRAVFGAR
jgi:selenocysteine lyase/cysteine desulfurase